MSDQLQNFDVIVVGAGLAGSALVCALAQGDQHLRIALVESQPLAVNVPKFDSVVDNFDVRVSALTLASQKFLQKLSVWEQIKRLAPYQKMYVWDADGTGVVDFDAREVNQPVLGHIVENRLTQYALIERLQQYASVQCYSLARVINITNEPMQKNNSGEGGERILQLEDGRKLSAPLIVAADGAQSNLRQLAGFTLREWDYDHRAIVATVELEQPHQATAWQRFMPEGPLAFLPLQGGCDEQTGEEKYFCSIVWSALPAYAEQLMALDNHMFSAQLTRAFEGRLGNVVAVSKRFCFPLRQRHAVDYVQPGLALVGDAAHTIHPLAGQGINLGFSDVSVLAEEILRARVRSLPLSDFSILRRYQRRRKADNLSMMAAMDGFKRLFAETNLIIRWARNSGMHWFNRSQSIKRALMRSAMGLR